MGRPVLDDTRCPRCGLGVLAYHRPTNDAAIETDAILCPACHAGFDVLWGAPFLASFGPEDAIGLIEIAANARSDNGYADRAGMERMEALLTRYHMPRISSNSAPRIPTPGHGRIGSPTAMTNG